jgi:hypothetical protein
MTSDACRALHKLEIKRDKAVNACSEELRRLIGSRLTEYSAEDALAQAIMDILLGHGREASIAAATSFLEGCGYVVTPSDYPERGK